MKDVLNGNGRIPKDFEDTTPFKSEDYMSEVKINSKHIEINCNGRKLEFNQCLNDI